MLWLVPFLADNTCCSHQWRRWLQYRHRLAAVYDVLSAERRAQLVQGALDGWVAAVHTARMAAAWRLGCLRAHWGHWALAAAVGAAGRKSAGGDGEGGSPRWRLREEFEAGLGAVRERTVAAAAAAAAAADSPSGGGEGRPAWR